MNGFQEEWLAIQLSFKLATVVTLLLLLAATPLAWWLARTRSRFRGIVNALVTLPLVLPPTVIGFYLLMAMGPAGFIGEMTVALGLGLLPFTFWGLVVASFVYSLPFVIGPIQTSMASIPEESLEAAATLGASPLDRFISIVLPLSKPGFLTAAVLGFAHTLGEFGVVLMIGGNIPGATQVISVLIYDHVDTMSYANAHWLAGFVVVVSLALLLPLYYWNKPLGGLLSGGRNES